MDFSIALLAGLDALLCCMGIFCFFAEVPPHCILGSESRVSGLPFLFSLIMLFSPLSLLFPPGAVILLGMFGAMLYGAFQILAYSANLWWGPVGIVLGLCFMCLVFLAVREGLKEG